MRRKYSNKGSAWFFRFRLRTSTLFSMIMNPHNRWLLSLIGLAVCIGTAGCSTGQPSVQPPNGLTLEYRKSNIDPATEGRLTEDIALYLASPVRVEAFKTRSKGTPAGLVVATLDPETFSASTLESYAVTGPARQQLQAQLAFDPETRIITGHAMGNTFDLSVPALSWHSLSFELSSLNAMLARLRAPVSTFTVGIADPNYTSQPGQPLFQYKGTLTFTFAGLEDRNGVETRRYLLSGPFLGEDKGHLWTNAQHGYIQELEIPRANHPAWSSYRLVLQDVSVQTESEWRQHIQAHFD